MKRWFKKYLPILCVILLLVGGGAWVWMERQTMLFDAAASGNLSAVKFLHFLGADLAGSPDDDYGGEPEPNIIAAVGNGHENVVRFFIEHHADIQSGYSDVQSPLEVAIGNRNYSMTELLLKNGTKLRHDWVDPNNWRPPLDDKMVQLLRRYDGTPVKNGNS